MKKNIFIALLLALAFTSCKKKDPATPNYDVVNKFFRVIVRSDANYTVTITQTAANSATPIVIKTDSDTGYEFNYGFAPKVGSTISVKVTTTSGTQINSSIFYKNVNIGPTVTTDANNKPTVNFSYTVKD